MITAAQIQQANANSIPDLLANSDGIYVVDASGVGTSSKINLRGFTTEMSSHHLVLVDGVPQNSLNDKLVDWNLIPLANIERIEVVRGPLSALYGDNAMSGVINIITKGRQPQPQTMLHAAYGSFDTLKWGLRTGSVAGPADYLVSIGQTRTAGFRDHGDVEISDVTGNLGFELANDARLTTRLQYSEIERGAHPLALSEAEIATDRRQARPGTEHDNSGNRKVNAGMTYEMPFLDTLSMTLDGYVRNEDGESFYTSGNTAASTAEILQNENLYGAHLACTAEPELWGIPHVFVSGAELERGTFDYEKYAAPSQLRGSLQSDYDAVRDRLGVYAEDEIAIGSRFRFLLGGRHSRLDYDFEDRLQHDKNSDQRISEDSVRIGASYAYRTSEGVAGEAPRKGILFASMAQAFRSPTLGEMFTYSSANPDLKPETAVNHEIGIRDPLGEHVDVRVSLYWMDLDDEIAYDYDARRYGNYGQTSHKGLEFGLEARLASPLSVFVNYTYTEALSEQGDTDGRELPHVPSHMGNAGVRYTHRTTWGITLATHLVGSSYLDADNTENLPSYHTVDLGGWYAAGPCRFFAAVDNLLDEDYATYGYTRADSNYYSPAPGTTFSTGVSATF